MIFSVNQDKGGPGKSTMTVNLAVYFALNGKDVVIVDGDPQHSCAQWHAERQAQEVTPSIALVEKSGDLRSTLLDLDRRYEIVLVDTAARDSMEMRTALTAAHVSLLPFRPSQFDLLTLQKNADLIEGARVINPELAAYAFLNGVSTNPADKDGIDAADLIRDYPAMRLLNTVIRERKPFRDSIPDGRGVLERNTRNTEKARAEITALAEEVIAA